MIDTISSAIVSILKHHGIQEAVVSPGSRNAPLLQALAAEDGIRKTVVIDERSAAFMALGMATMSRRPTLLVCTSGSALLNYSPALAEAYYRCVPLIVISADRPIEWIGQDDSQTIRQRDALDNIVKRSYDLTVCDKADNQWYVNRIVNDAVLCSQSSRPGPVHINLQISDPGASLAPVCKNPRLIHSITPKTALSTSEVRQMAKTIASPLKVMIVAGFMMPDTKVNKALNKLSLLPNIVLLTETISNIHCPRAIDCIDATLSTIPLERIDEYRPDIIITLGGALVSRHIKQFLRECRPQQNWYIGSMEETIDCFRNLTLRIELDPAVFLPQLASALQPHQTSCDYATKWEVLKNKSISLRQSFCTKIPWCDFKLFDIIIRNIPRRYNVHYSNGTAIRYAQIFGDYAYHRCECNRGVSGIDGCTSTAIGASIIAKDTPTLLISGDMSAAYDLGALAIHQIPSTFKMIVIDNGGGGIFHFIQSTRNLDIVDEYLSAPPAVPLTKIAKACGFKCYEANDEDQLIANLELFFAETDSPSFLTIHTDGKLSAEILTSFFRAVSPIFVKTRGRRL